MATMIQGFMTTWGSASSDAAAVRTIADESQLWTGGYSGLIGNDPTNFGHLGERVATPNETYKAFNTASAFAMLGFEGRGMQGGVGSRWGFRTAGNASVARIYIGSSVILLEVGGSTVATYTHGLVNTTYYTVEFAYGTSGGNVRSEVRLNGARVPALTTDNFTAATGQSAGALSSSIAAGAGGTAAMSRAMMNEGTQASPVLYYWWQKNHSALWTTVPSGGTAFVDQSDFLGIKKKYLLVPNSIAAPFNAYNVGGGTVGGANWTNGAGTHPTNLADAPIDDTLYVQNQNDGGGADVAGNILGQGYTDLPAAATRVGWVQRTCWARTFQAGSSGILARSGIRSGAADTPASTNFFDYSLANAPSFGQTYSPGLQQGAGDGNTSLYYPRQGHLAQFTTGGTDVWSVATVNAIHGLFESVDIL
jgi:hypothetical protein